MEIAQDRRYESPCIADRLRRVVPDHLVELRLPVDRGPHRRAHDAGQTVFLYAAIATDRRGRQRVVLIGNEFIDRLREGDAGSCPFLLDKPGADGAGFCLTQLRRRFGD